MLVVVVALTEVIHAPLSRDDSRAEKRDGSEASDWEYDWECDFEWECERVEECTKKKRVRKE
jgi:hypothetical protein